VRTRRPAGQAAHDLALSLPEALAQLLRELLAAASRGRHLGAHLSAQLAGEVARLERKVGQRCEPPLRVAIVDRVGAQLAREPDLARLAPVLPPERLELAGARAEARALEQTSRSDRCIHTLHGTADTARGLATGCRTAARRAAGA
jgi:hypothetical protein